MKKVILVSFLFIIAITTYAQRYAYVDTQYILNNIPAYKAAQDKLDQLSFEWQQELESKREEIEQLTQEFQSEKVLLTEEMKKKRQNQLEKRRQELQELKRKYFGPEGQLYQKRQELVRPIQEEVYGAIETIASRGNYAVIFDAAGESNMLYTDPSYDKSDEVLQELGYKN
ncbi:MAG: OmpH family outer membrane protein [Bacteroidales bacterium]|nr:OmpH family outer membrane protein [Bacteroidales bacterium]